MPTAEKVRHLGAAELLDAVLDRALYLLGPSRRQPDPDPASTPPTWPGRGKRSGVDESVLTGDGLIRGRRVAVIVSEFRSWPVRSAPPPRERIVAAVERATAEGLPLLAGPASGGTRMQEGTLAFLSMVKITARRPGPPAGRPALPGVPAAPHHRRGHGVLGIAGPHHRGRTGRAPRVPGPAGLRGAVRHAFPENVQVAENLFDKGLIDAVVPPGQLADLVDRALDILCRRPAPAPLPGRCPGNPRRPARRRRRLDLHRDLPESAAAGPPPAPQYGASDVLPLNGTGQGEKDPGLLLALARFGGQSCVVLGHARPRRKDAAGMGPASLREARRGMKLAEELRLPLLTVIDTAGAALSKEAEEGGLAGEIARSLHDLIGLESPSVSVLLGQGAGGGALALLPGRPDHRGPARLAVAAAARGRQRHRAPHHRLRAGHVAGAGRQRRGPVRQRAGGPHRGRTRRRVPGTRANSAHGWRRPSSTSWPRLPRCRYPSWWPRGQGSSGTWAPDARTSPRRWGVPAPP